MKHLAVFLEQITPEIRREGRNPGESFEEAFRNLKQIEDKDIQLFIKVFIRLAELPNQGFIEVCGIFERDLMHELTPSLEGAKGVGNG